MVRPKQSHLILKAYLLTEKKGSGCVKEHIKVKTIATDLPWATGEGPWKKPGQQAMHQWKLLQ